MKTTIFPACIEKLESHGNKGNLNWLRKHIVGTNFCDANGDLFILESIEIINRTWNLHQLIINDFKPTYRFKYHLTNPNISITIEELKSICEEMAKIMFNEDVHAEVTDQVKNGTTVQEVWDVLWGA